jgi:FKBP-type peptidyl-prolyl cis-trans isomerase
MLRAIVLLGIVALVGAPAFAQGGTPTKKSTAKSSPARKTAPARPNPNAPAKVTGPGTTTPSGLQYWDIKLGTGRAAQQGDSVSVNYTGWLTNGKKFDSSIGRGPFTVEPLGTAPVIKGWNEGIAGMKVGGKRQLRIPADLAYGAQGYPGVIPPNATLIFDVQLLAVK